MNNYNPSVFLVEDDINFGAILKSYLELQDFQVTWVDDGRHALAVFLKGQFDICILDVMLPHVDGFTIAREIRKSHPAIPLIFLTAKTLKADIVEGFRSGADDYITKPFDSEVLLYKIRAILKRNTETMSRQKQQEFIIGSYHFNSHLRTITRGDDSKRISPKESDLLRLLCVEMNNVLPRELALRTIWGDDNYFTTRSMDVFVSKLRKYLADDQRIEIENIHGTGYRLMVKQA